MTEKDDKNSNPDKKEAKKPFQQPFPNPFDPRNQNKNNGGVIHKGQKMSAPQPIRKRVARGT